MSGCRYPGCARSGLHHADQYCTEHDGRDHGPLVCVCPVAWPTDGWSGQCVTCLRPVVHLWDPDRYRAALAAYPQLVDQQIDWTLRTATVTPPKELTHLQRIALRALERSPHEPYTGAP